MQRSIIGATASICLILLIAVLVKNNGGAKSTDTATPEKSMNIATGLDARQPEDKSADKIEVVHFHATQQCYSCITVGELALKTIKEKFPEEYANGKIVFRDINGELQENRDMVMKYRAGGSSLFVNAIKDGQDNIEEDTTVWRLISDENQFMDYFQGRLNKLLGE